MQSFCKISEGLDVVPLLHALTTKRQLWNANRERTAFAGSPHVEADDIWLWFNRVGENKAEIYNDILVIPYAWDSFPEAHKLVFDLMYRVRGVQLGRVVITRLPTGKTISRHADGGLPAEYFQRYQIALQSLPGCVFHCGDEAMEFSMGECWWIDNQQPHQVVNNSADDRIAMVLDIRTS